MFITLYSMYSSSIEVTNSSEILTGRVKWFNNKTGFGFITVTDGSNVGSDIFVHHSSINVLSEQYKYLVQGEYVEFVLCDTPEGKHMFQAGNVKGIKGGQLMCETRREFKVARNNFKDEKLEVTIKNDVLENPDQGPIPIQSQSQGPRQSQAPRPRHIRSEGSRQRHNENESLNQSHDQGEWSRVVKKGIKVTPDLESTVLPNKTLPNKRGRKPKETK